MLKFQRLKWEGTLGTNETCAFDFEHLFHALDMFIANAIDMF